MEIDRKMVRYLLEIKRSLPHAKQSEFNLSSPNIKKIVLDVHRSTTNSKIKTLAAAFLEQAGRRPEGENQNKINPVSGDIAKPQQQPSNREGIRIMGRNNGTSSTSPKLGVVSGAKINSAQNELLKAGILPEFLEHIDVSELPPLVGLTSNDHDRPMQANKTSASSSPKTKSVRQGTAILDKVAIFLTTPIELSMPIKFAKRGPDASN